MDYSNVLVNIVSFSHGVCAGWLSPQYGLLSSEDSPLSDGPMTTEELSWAGANICTGAILATWVTVTMSHRMGRKFALNFIAYPQIIFWLLIIFGNNAMSVIVGRFFGGMGGGSTFSSVPLFVADIAEPK